MPGIEISARLYGVHRKKNYQKDDSGYFQTDAHNFDLTWGQVLSASPKK